MPASATTVTAASAPFREQPVERRLQHFELGVAADHLRGHAFDAARADAEGPWLGAQDEVALHRRVDALDRQRRLRVDLEQAAHLRVGVVADAQGRRPAPSAPSARRC